jgi:hypothetical protein
MINILSQFVLCLGAIGIVAAAALVVYLVSASFSGSYSND